MTRHGFTEPRFLSKEQTCVLAALNCDQGGPEVRNNQTKSAYYTKYLREIKKILGFQLLILDDFLLNTIMDEREVKVLMEILEKRIEASKSTIVCSQREPGSWKAMIMNDEVSANAIMKRATKHYIVVSQPIEIP